LSHAGDDDPCDFFRELADDAAETAPKLPIEVQLQQVTIKKYKEFFAKKIKEFGEEKYMCTHGGCIIKTDLISRELDRYSHFTPQQSKSEGITKLQVIRLGRKLEFKYVPYHFFVTDSKFSDDLEVIIDGTYHQFLRDSETLDLPSVFVGTREELVALFTKHQAHIMPKHDDFLGITNSNQVACDPQEFVEKTWGFGSGVELRKNYPPGVNPEL